LQKKVTAPKGLLLAFSDLPGTGILGNVFEPSGFLLVVERLNIRLGPSHGIHVTAFGQQVLMRA
jgi:hypothetical protein